MCGIVGYLGQQQATGVLIGGLRKLEYRGYDSAGVAIAGKNGTEIVRCQGKLAALEALIGDAPPVGTIGIGHTRWATHGRPSDENAHPHRVGSVSVVHNGIIENHMGLRARLRAGGREFKSETDTEIVAHLIDEALLRGSKSLSDAVCKALRQVEGAYAIVVMSEQFPQDIVAAKNASPMVLGIGKNEMFIASDAPALLQHTREVVFLEDGDVALLSREGYRVIDVEGHTIERHPRTITWTADQAEKGGFAHFMLKEIYEQPQAVTNTLRGRLLVPENDALLDDFVIDTQKVRRVVIIACGTSWHAGLVGKFMIEATSRLPVEVDLASEFRYRNPVVGPDVLVIAISQSGETADTLAALKEAKARGAITLGISNVVDSAIARTAHGVLYTHAGLEIGVASTKCFTAQLAALALVAIHAGRRSGTLSQPDAQALINELLLIPQKMEHSLHELGDLKELAARYKDARDFLFLGRGTNYPIALEGALKLKEISYIHAEGYAAGEMKHGPIALIDDGIPVVVIAPKGTGYDKVLSNMAEVRARQGTVIAVATVGDKIMAENCEEILWIPDAPALLQPLLTVLPLQILSYAVALARGNDVDQPRNLAKSVTVE